MTLTREENLQYRRSCPYDAMGDYSVFNETKNKQEIPNKKEPAPPLIAKEDRQDEGQTVGRG